MNKYLISFLRYFGTCACLIIILIFLWVLFFVPLGHYIVWDNFSLLSTFENETLCVSNNNCDDQPTYDNILQHYVIEGIGGVLLLLMLIIFLGSIILVFGMIGAGVIGYVIMGILCIAILISPFYGIYVAIQKIYAKKYSDNSCIDEYDY